MRRSTSSFAFLTSLAVAVAVAACGGRTALDGDGPPDASDDGDAQGATTDDAGPASDGSPAPSTDATAADGAGPPRTTVPTYLMNPAHTSAIGQGGPTPPLARVWTASLGMTVSYPLVVDGVVYVTTGSRNVHPVIDAQLFALEAATGKTLWSANLGQSSFLGLAYDQGRVFAMEDTDATQGLPHLHAFDATTGAVAWEAQPDNQGSFDVPPVAYRGMLYVYGRGFGGTVYAYDETSGTIVWRAGTQGGGEGSPAVSDDGVFLVEDCQQIYAFERLSGSPLWRHMGSCTGGLSATAVLQGSRLYVRDTMGGLVLDATSGGVLGSFVADLAPAFDGTSGYAVVSGTLRAFDPLHGSTSWTFAGDGRLSTAPLAAGGYVYVGSSEANLFAVSASTGSQVWTDNAGMPLQSREDSGSGPRYGLAAAGGLLFVPSGSSLIAYGSAGQAEAGAGVAADAAADSGCAWSLAPVSPSPATENIPAALAVGDLNGDGHPDLVVSNSQVDTLSTLLGHGDGTFAAGNLYTVGTSPGSLDLGDFNRDGKLDVVVVDMYSGNMGAPSTVSLLLGNGDGTLQPQVTLTTGNAPTQVAARDFNGDGKTDLAVLATGFLVYLGKGDGTFASPLTYAPGAGPEAFTLGDWNGDGAVDVAMTDGFNQDVAVLLGMGDGTFQTGGTYAMGTACGALAAGDVNADGKLDLAVGGCGAVYTGGSVGVMLGNGDGGFGPASAYTTGVGPAGLQLADLNGDGHADLAVANGGADTASILLGRGDGTFEPQFVIGTGEGPAALDVTDLNGDGRPDLAVVNSDSDSVSVFLGSCGGG